jgi:hypothetical protein
VTLLLAYGVARAVVVDLSMVEDVRVKVERAMGSDAYSIGILGLGAQLPDVTESAPLQRFRIRPCESLQDAHYIVFQPTYVQSEFGRTFGERLAAGVYGFRRVELETFTPPRWLYDVQPASTNLAWINMPTSLFERDPSRPCRNRAEE